MTHGQFSSCTTSNKSISEISFVHQFADFVVRSALVLNLGEPTLPLYTNLYQILIRNGRLIVEVG